MENEYENIMSLVEEVKDILEHSELSEKAFPAGWKGPKSFKKSKNRQNPFSGLKAGKRVIGPGPKGRTLRKAIKWACSCRGTAKGGSMSVCHCLGRDGQTKTVRIGKAYKNTYNAKYRAWRKRPKQRKRFAGGAGSPFRKR